MIKNALISVALTLVVCQAVSAAILRVPVDYTSIQSAVNGAVDGDTVQIDSGNYTENVLIDSKSIVILGDTLLHTVLINAANSGAPVLTWLNVQSLNAQAVGLTISGSVGSPGILCDNSAIYLRRNIIRGNSGSGIRVAGAVTSIIEDNEITDNYAVNGGGVCLDEGGADVRRNFIARNRADLGGAIFSDNRMGLTAKSAPGNTPDFEIAGNVILGNRAYLGGGGIYLYEGFPVLIADNLFVDDTSGFGGGIDNSGRHYVVVRGNTFDRCVAGGGGGNAIWWARHANVGGIIKNNIFSSCSSLQGVGGAVGCDPEIVGTVDLDFNDAWSNSPSDYYTIVPGANSIFADPLYCSAIAGDYGLQPGSPCLASGEGGGLIGARGLGCTIEGPVVTSVAVLGEEPLHLIDNSPVFTWGYFHSGGLPQTHFEIEVGSDGDWTAVEFWQPGVSQGAENSIPYNGIALVDGQQFFVRLRVYDGSEWSDWYARQFRMNTAPLSPSPMAPSDGQIMTSGLVALQVATGGDPDGDSQEYVFEVFSDQALMQLVASRMYAVSTYWYVNPSFSTDGQYWWRARASDGYEESPWSEISTFFVDAINDPPAAFDLVSPVDGTVIYDQTPILDWDDAVDPDPAGTITSYSLALAIDSAFGFSTTYSGIPNSLFLAHQLPYGARYWWRVTAFDNRGGQRTTEAWAFVVPAPGDVNADLRFNVTDVVMLIDIVFRGSTGPEGLLTTDVNGDCVIDVRDIVVLIGYMFRAAPLPGVVCGDTQPSGRKLRVPEDYPTIQIAVDAAVNGDTVCVSPGTYIEAVIVDGLDIVLMGDPTSYSVTLQPPGPALSPIRFENTPLQTTQIVGFVIRGAEGVPAVRCMDASPTIKWNRIVDNLSGGIVFSGQGNGRVEGNYIARNSSNYGGGVLLYGASADIVGNVFEQNRAWVGGGFCGYGEAPHVVDRNVFRGNYASGGGGGVYLISEGRITISNNLFVHDTSDHGGGLDNSGRDSVVVINNTFDNCVAGLGGGGGNAIWWSNNGDVGCIIKNNTFTNTRSLNGQGGAVGGDPGVVGLVSVEYNAVWNNTPAHYYRLNGGLGSVIGDPLYCEPLNEDYRLGPGSPCLNAGEGGMNIGAFGPGCGP